MALWWHFSLHNRHVDHFASYNAANTMQRFSSFALHSFLTRTGYEYQHPKISPDNSAPEWHNNSTTYNSRISCFCDDHPLLTFHKEESTLTLRSKLEIRYSPWATNMLNGLDISNRKHVKEFTGGPTGGGSDGDDDGSGGDGDDDGDEYIYILPLLTILFAAFHFGYCTAVWMKDKSLNVDFVWTAAGLFLLLVVSAIRLSHQTGLDAFVLGLGASVGVMLWTDYTQSRLLEWLSEERRKITNKLAFEKLDILKVSI